MQIYAKSRCFGAFSLAAVHCHGNTEIWLIGWRAEPVVSSDD